MVIAAGPIIKTNQISATFKKANICIPTFATYIKSTWVKLPSKFFLYTTDDSICVL